MSTSGLLSRGFVGAATFSATMFGSLLFEKDLPLDVSLGHKPPLQVEQPTIAPTLDTLVTVPQDDPKDDEKAQATDSQDFLFEPNILQPEPTIPGQVAAYLEPPKKDCRCPTLETPQQESLAPRDSSWFQQMELDGLYRAIAQDLKEGKPLIISNYMGLWIDGKPPETNLYWGALYGHETMFDEATTNHHIAGNFTNHNWEKVYSKSNGHDPIVTAVYRMNVKPNASWRSRGVDKPFTIYQVYQVFKSNYQAGTEMFHNLKHDQGRVIELDDRTVLNLGEDSRLVGYIGHNFLMDGIVNNEIDAMRKATTDVKGSFAIGCQTSIFFGPLSERGTFNVLYTNSNMAPEGYTSLALADGISRALPGKKLAELGNSAYRYWQVLGGQKKPGPLFVNHVNSLFK